MTFPCLPEQQVPQGVGQTFPQQGRAQLLDATYSAGLLSMSAAGSRSVDRPAETSNISVSEEYLEMLITYLHLRCADVHAYKRCRSLLRLWQTRNPWADHAEVKRAVVLAQPQVARDCLTCRRVTFTPWAVCNCRTLLRRVLHPHHVLASWQVVEAVLAIFVRELWFNSVAKEVCNWLAVNGEQSDLDTGDASVFFF